MHLDYRYIYHKKKSIVDLEVLLDDFDDNTYVATQRRKLDEKGIYNHTYMLDLDTICYIID